MPRDNLIVINLNITIHTWMSSQLDSTLEILHVHQLDISKFIVDLLSNQHYADHPVVCGLISNLGEICAALTNASGESGLNWICDFAKEKYKSDIVNLVKGRHGWEFSAIHMLAKQIEDF